MNSNSNDTKKQFRKLGSCSHTLFYILNREFGYENKLEGRAADPLAGGILQQGYQCGMLWGASLAVGAECYRRFGNTDVAIGVAVKATQLVIKSFLEKEESIECGDITECNWSSKLSMAKYFFTGKFLSCFNLAEEWAPEAIKAAYEGLTPNNNNYPNKCVSCASEIVKNMGGTDEEIVMVAGFAGGLGLSGSACGALSASIWKKHLELCKLNSKTSYRIPNADEKMEIFYALSNYEIECSAITGKQFNSIEEHSSYIENGGCSSILEELAI